MSRRISLLITGAMLTCSMSCIAQGPSSWATLSGRVMDMEGHPVPGATITFFPMDVAMNGPLPSPGTTNDAGEYRFSLPAFSGRTRLCAVKPSAGYPDAQGLLFVSGEETLPVVHLTPGASIENVDIRLGRPDGVIEGIVVDKVTRIPLTNARITLHRKDPESMFSSTLGSDGKFLFALPSAPIEIIIQAPGYTGWEYKDEKTGLNALVLDSSDHRFETVELLKH